MATPALKGPRRVAALALAASLAAAGCGSTGSASPSQQAPTTAPTAAPPSVAAATPSAAAATASPGATYDSWINTVASTDPIKIRIVESFDPNNVSEHNQNLMDHATAEWKKRYPNGTIDWELVGWGDIDQKTPAFVQAGDNVDITYNWGGATNNWCKAGFLVPIQKYMPEWWTNSRIPQAFKAPANDLCPDGSLVMAAYGVESQFALVRKDLLDKAGVDPASMATYDGFLAGLKAISDKAGMKTPMALSLGADWTTMDDISFLWLGSGVNFGEFRADGSEKDAWIKAATFVRDLAKLGPKGQLTWSHDDVNQAYATGVVSAIQAGNWYFDTLTPLDKGGKVFNEANTILLPYPSDTGGPGPFHSASYTGLYMLSTSPEANRQAAADLMSIISDTKTVWLHDDATVPPTTGWTGADRLKTAYNPSVGWWYTQLQQVNSNKGIDYPGFAARDQITAAAYPLLVEMFRGNLTPEQLYEQVRALALPLIQQAQ